MNFHKGVLFMFCMAYLLPSSSALAAYCDSSDKHKAPAGQVCLYNHTLMCRPGCYCTGGGKQLVSDGDFQKGCEQRWGSWNNHGGGWTLCPSDFPKSDQGASKESDCYQLKNNGGKFYKIARGCDEGTYLKAGTQNEPCEPCPNGYYCPRNPYMIVSLTKDQNLNKCPDGQVANSDHTGCKKSASGSDNANADPDIIVNAGEYLPANAAEAVKCTSSSGTRKQYCPGGVFKKFGQKQGIVDCPYNADATNDKKGCTLTLSKDQMKFGVVGGKSGDKSNACWARIDPTEFKECVLGKQETPTKTNTLTLPAQLLKADLKMVKKL